MAHRSLLNVAHGHRRTLRRRGALPPQTHVFESASIDAINAALLSCRPLLVRGRPGVGKSQLAFAAAEELGWPCCAHVLDGRTEARDLLWTFDAVGRLARAQALVPLLPALGLRDAAAVRAEIDRELAERNFLKPGPLWWALDWEGACDVSGERPAVPEGWSAGSSDQGVVVLLDEIDKADSDAPNGLLEVLGEGRFSPPGCIPVVAKGRAPLVIITTNEERALPDAFVRRCLVHHLEVREEDLVGVLMERGEAHFGTRTSPEVRLRAANLLSTARKNWPSDEGAPPGQAEYLDLLRAVVELTDDDDEQLRWIDRLQGFSYEKHRRPDQERP